MHGHGFLTQIKGCGDPVIAGTVHDECENVSFSRGEFSHLQQIEGIRRNLALHRGTHGELLQSG